MLRSSLAGCGRGGGRGVRSFGAGSDGALFFQHCFPPQPPAPKCTARLGAPCCWWQSALLASKSERPSGDLFGLQRSSWPRFSGAPQRLCTAPASWAEPSFTVTSAWSSSHWSLETAATSLCCWWTQAVGPGPRSCSSRCMVSAPDTGSPAARRALESCPASRDLGRTGFQRPLASDLAADSGPSCPLQHI